MRLNIMRLNKLLTSTGAALLLASGLATQANAGAINMDFLLDANTVITGADALDSAATNADDNKTSTPSALSAGFAVDLAPFGAIKYAGKSLNITGTRSAVVNEGFFSPQPQDMRLTRYEGNGLAVCSNTASNSTGTGCDEDHQVDGAGGLFTDINESIKFDITGGYVFAVRQVTFKFADDNDNVLMRFSTGLGQSVDFALNDDSDNAWRTCTSGTCVVDIYQLVAGMSSSDGLVFDSLTNYTLGQDAIFDYLASGSGFEFAALDSDDDWKIAGAVWVDEDPITNGVPEPASMTLLGAGIMGLGYLNRRRKAA